MQRAARIPSTMTRAVLEAIGKIAVVEAPVPEPGPAQVLVRLRAVGICGSDVHYYVDGRIGDAMVQFPFVLGHEPAGEVAAIGPGVTGLAVGDRVALEPAHACGCCAICRQGRPNCCPYVRFLGTPPVAGVYEEFHLFAVEQCAPIPASVSFAAAAALEPMAVAMHAVNLARLRLGDRVAVMGGGPIGLLTVLAARLAGAGFILLTEPIAARRARAREFGADMAIDPQASNAAEEFRRAGEIDVAFEAAGVQEAIDDATLSVRPGGTAVIIGIPAEDHVSLWAHHLRRKELNLIMARRSGFELEQAIRLTATGLIHPERIVTHRFPLACLADALEFVRHYRDGVVKALIVME